MLYVFFSKGERRVSLREKRFSSLLFITDSIDPLEQFKKQFNNSRCEKVV